MQVAVDTIGEFLRAHEMTVYLLVFDREAYVIGQKRFDDIAAYIDDRYVSAHTDSRQAQRRRYMAAPARTEAFAPCATAAGSLDEALKRYAEGAELIRTSSQQLDEAKLKIETLFPQEVLGEDDDE